MNDSSAPPSAPPEPPSSAATHPPGVRPPFPWSTGLCDCCDDLGICCLTFWCPCVIFGRIAEIVDRGVPSCEVSAVFWEMILCLTGCACVYSYFYRSKMRAQYLIGEGPCADICVHCWCEPCALCQEYRQLQSLGIDPSLGWDGNLKKQQRQGVMSMAPRVQEAMNR